MSLLQPRNGGKQQSSQYTHKRGKHLPEPHHGSSPGPEELYHLVRLVQILLALDIELSVVGILGQAQLGREAHVGFVEWDEEDREDLVDLDEEEMGGLVIFYIAALAMPNMRVQKLGYEPLHSTSSRIRGDRILYQR
jgi:hypothetical protein